MHDRDLAIVAEFWEDLDSGLLDRALSRVGERGAWRPLAGGEVFEGRAGMAAYVERLRTSGIELRGHAYAIERDGDGVVVRGVVRYARPGRFTETQGRWVHRVRDGAVAGCVGVPASVESPGPLRG